MNAAKLPPDNPFATRHTRPGAIPYLFPSGESAETLVDRLRANGWQGEILGPHGAGKSTLLQTLLPALAAAGRDVRLIALHDGERNVPAEPLRELTDRTQVIIDGYEQLSRWNCAKLHRSIRRARAGLLVTTHTQTGMPPLIQVEPDEAVVQHVVAQLLSNTPAAISPAEVSAAFQATSGNARETLFALYEAYERKRQE